jgi:hypothetical protein
VAEKYLINQKTVFSVDFHFKALLGKEFLASSVHAPEYKFGAGKLKIEVHINGEKVGEIHRHETKEFVIKNDAKVIFLEHSLLSGTKQPHAWLLKE